MTRKFTAGHDFATAYGVKTGQNLEDMLELAEPTSELVDGVTLNVDVGNDNKLEVKDAGIGPTQLGTVHDNVTIGKTGGGLLQVKASGISAGNIAAGAIVVTAPTQVINDYGSPYSLTGDYPEFRPHATKASLVTVVFKNTTYAKLSGINFYIRATSGGTNIPVGQSQIKPSAIYNDEAQTHTVLVPNGYYFTMSKNGSGSAYTDPEIMQLFHQQIG